MVVNDLNVNGIGLRPAETDPPLVVFPNAVLPRPIAAQGFKTVSRNRAQVRQFPGGVNVIQFPLCRRSNPLELPAEFASTNLVGFFVAEGPDHSSSILPALNAKRQTGLATAVYCRNVS